MESPEGSGASKGGSNVDLEILASDLETLSAPTMEGLEELITTVCSFAFPLCISGSELRRHHILIYLHNEKCNPFGNSLSVFYVIQKDVPI